MSERNRLRHVGALAPTLATAAYVFATPVAHPKIRWRVDVVVPRADATTLLAAVNGQTALVETPVMFFL